MEDIQSQSSNHKFGVDFSWPSEEGLGRQEKARANYNIKRFRFPRTCRRFYRWKIRLALQLDQELNHLEWILSLLKCKVEVL